MISGNISSNFIHDRLRNILPARKKNTLEETSNKFEIQFIDGVYTHIDLALLRCLVKPRELIVTDLIKEACRFRKIHPSNAVFFGLKTYNKSVSKWIIPTIKIQTLDKKLKYVLRLQFKVLDVSSLRKIDDVYAYQYYLLQCRHDFKNGVYANLVESKNETDLLRMVILEMYIVHQTTAVSLKDLLKNKRKDLFNIDGILRKYPNRGVDRDIHKCKQKIARSLEVYKSDSDPGNDFIYEIEQLDHYRDEVFSMIKYEDGKIDKREIFLTPTDICCKFTISNVRSCLWQCSYSNICGVKVQEYFEGKGREIRILRRNERAEILFCESEEECESFFSFMEGYYRLLVNQYETILYDTNSILKDNMVHGPISQKVAENIITAKGIEEGNYLFREHCQKYFFFVLSYVSYNETIKHIEIEYCQEDSELGYYLLNGTKYPSLNVLQNSFKDAKVKDELGVVLKKNYVPRQSGNIPFYMEPGHILHNITNKRNIALSKLPAAPLLLGSDQLRCEQWIKKGAFGDVMKYIKKDENKSLVLKRFIDIPAEHVNLVAQSLMCLHDHKHIVQFVGLSLLDNGLMLAFEYLELGNLENYLPKSRESITYGLLLKYLGQLGDAVKFLHSKDLVHGDLQLKNIYLSDVQTIKLSNSCIMWRLSEHIEKSYVKNNCTHYAPEIFLADKPVYTKETDIWAFALTILQLFTLEKPFKTMTYFEMKNFFHEYLNKCSSYSSTLAFMNLESPCHCPIILRKLFNDMLCFKPNERKNIAEVHKNISELLRTPTREKEKIYFTFDWKSHIDIDCKKNESSMVDSGVSDSRNYQKISASMVYGIHQEENMEVDNGDFNPAEQLSSIDNKQTEKLSLINNSNLIMQNNKLKLLIKDKHSRSAPCSPTQNKLVNLYSLDDCDKAPEVNFSKDLISLKVNQKTVDNNDVDTYQQSFYRTSFLPNKSCSIQDQVENFSSEKSRYCFDKNKNNQSESDIDIKTASILLDLSQANSSSPYVDIKCNSHIQQIKPYIQTFNSAVSTREDYAPKLDSLASVAKADFAKISPPPTPPDSPEQVRRDTSDQPKREWFRNPKTRQYLQERINFERERFYGKRSISFQEESNEYTENTKKIAKMALQGPNPFNIGISLPHRFFGKKDIPLNPPPFSSELSRFFKNEFEESSVKHDDNDFSNPYRSLQDLELIRKNIFTSSNNASNKTQSEIQSVVKDFKDLQASSPNPFISHLSTSHAAVISTINVFTNNPGIASVGTTSTIQSSFQGGKPIVSSSVNRSYGGHSEGKRQSRKNKDYALKTDIYSVAVSHQIPETNSLSENGQTFPMLKQQSIQPRLLGVNTRFSTSATQSSLHCTIAPASRTIYISHNSTQEPIQLFPRAHFNGSPVTSIQSLQVLNPQFITGSPIISQATFQKSDLTMPLKPSIDSTILSRSSSGHFSSPSGIEESQNKNSMFTFSEEHLPSMFRFIERKDLKIEESLGQGQFGEVFKGLWLFTDKNKIKLNVPVAIKKLLQKDTTSNISKDIQDFRREAKTMAALSKREISDSQYIVKLHGVCAEGSDTDFSIVTEYLSMGSLDQFIPLRKKELNSGYLLVYCKQIAHGVDYLHTQNILHRDLACRNVLVADKELVKLSDFGLSRFLFDKGYYDNEKFQKLPVQWLALESMEKCLYTQKTDIWSYGVVLWEMFTLFQTEIKDLPVIPYKEIPFIDLPAYLRSGARLSKPDCFPVELWSLSVKCWNLLEDERPSFYAFKEFIGNLLESAPIKTFF
ncbi:uncharacterized protein LOC100199166 isoform X3 [Hydra vulgaris]|uniref:non-specific protein-tyrosine kinase n=1 Tax=Hydra vulgaris TaxID=6087 RepID=A0ABM4CJV1_HYDVU